MGTMLLPFYNSLGENRAKDDKDQSSGSLEVMNTLAADGDVLQWWTIRCPKYTRGWRAQHTCQDTCKWHDNANTAIYTLKNWIFKRKNVIHWWTSISFNTALSCHRQVVSLEQKQNQLLGEHTFYNCSMYNDLSPHPSAPIFLCLRGHRAEH